MSKLALHSSGLYPLQIGLVAVRRPDVIEATLESYARNLFPNFEITKAFVNVDPVFGDEADHQKSVDCIRHYLPNATIREPIAPSFGGAVKWVWSCFSDGLALHLEDDWLLNTCLKPNDILPLFGRKVSAVSLVADPNPWYKRTGYVWVGTRRKFPNAKWATRKSPFLGTSPKFIDGKFARCIAELMVPNLDPEKQMLPKNNGVIFNLFQENRCVYIKKNSSNGVLTEIGRDWRSERKIDKFIIDGKSVWEEGN